MDTKLTIGDIQRITGFSRATIDRVVNNRGKVKAETRSAILSAIAMTGYRSRKTGGTYLAEQAEIDILVAYGINPIFQQVAAAFKGVVSDAMYLLPKCNLYGFNPHDPDHLLEVLNQAKARKTRCIVMIGVDTLRIRRKISELSAAGCRVVTVISDVPNSGRHCFIGQSSFDAGRTAAAQMYNMIDERSGKIVAVVGDLRRRHFMDRISGFQQTTGLRAKALECVLTEPYLERGEVSLRDIRRKTEAMPDLRGVYISGGATPSLYDFLRSLKETHPEIITVVHECHALSIRALEDGAVSAIISHDLEEVARKAMRAAVSDENYEDLSGAIRIHTPENITGAELL